MEKLTDERVREMLAQLREHFRQPVMPVGLYCEAFRNWVRAIEMAVDRTVGTSQHETHKSMLKRIGDVRLDVTKSNLLYRLLYVGEKFRTEPCPIHKGEWSGMESKADKKCPHCMSGNDVTGWVDAEPKPDRTDAMQVNFEFVHGLPPKPEFVYLTTTALAPESMGAHTSRPFVFTITSVELDEHKRPRTRCWGWFETFKQAEEHLVHDYGDIHEGGTNPWAVITKCESGVCPHAFRDEDQWYRFVPMATPHRYTAERIEMPKEVDNYGILGGLG